MTPPALLPPDRVPYEALSDYHRATGAWPTPATAPEVFADRLAEEGFALARADRFVGGDELLADTFDAAGAIAYALRRIRERRVAAARRWLWAVRERAVVATGETGRR